MLLLQRGPHGELGCITVRISGCRRNVALMFQPLAQLRIAAAHVFSQNMPARGFVLRQIAPWTGCRPRVRSRTLTLRGALIRWLAAGEQKEKKCGENVSLL